MKSQYISLADLQKMSPVALLDLWYEGKFPFDLARTCNSCIIQHDWPTTWMCSENSHAMLRESAKELKAQIDSLGPYLERIYALRLFYQDLYASNPPELDAMPIKSISNTSQVQLEDVRIFQSNEKGEQVHA